jgi:hypothetical protein
MDLGHYKYSSLQIASMRVINRLHSIHGEILEELTRTLVLVTDADGAFSGRLSHILPNLLRQSGGLIYDVALFVCDLDELSVACSVNGQPHAVHQEMLFTAGLHHVIFDVLLCEDDQAPEVLAACYRALRLMSAKNPAAQTVTDLQFGSLLILADDL